MKDWEKRKETVRLPGNLSPEAETVFEDAMENTISEVEPHAHPAVFSKEKSMEFLNACTEIRKKPVLNQEGFDHQLPMISMV